MELSSYTTTYWDYLQRAGLTLSEAAKARIAAPLAQTDWDDPQSVADCCNSAVMALIEAEQTGDRDLREMYLETAIALLSPFAETDRLCAIHLMIINSLIGEAKAAIQQAFSQFMAQLQSVYAPDAPPDSLQPRLIFLPLAWRSHLETDYFALGSILETASGDRQIALMLGEILCQSQLVFYNATGLRFLQLAIQLFPNSASLNLKLGISSVLNGQWEGLLYLHRAQQLAPQQSTFLQALYLAYRNLNESAIAEQWRATAQEIQATDANSLGDRWLKSTHNTITFVPFAQQQLAVESSFQSIVTSVLLAEGRWFEREMEFWQDQLQPGMIVIDVGANVGVYAIAAAQQVGKTGRVLAVEPFSGCVKCLQETCRVNGLDWVTVCQGAASDRDGTIRLGLHAASELNQVITADSTQTADCYEEVPCFQLDTLVEEAQLPRVDLLKIDAEGHELQVLMGSDRLLEQFAPIILYENIAASQDSNLPVAEYLIAKGYQLFRYQPYIKQLLPIESESELQGNLNIIALPKRLVAQ